MVTTKNEGSLFSRHHTRIMETDPNSDDWEDDDEEPPPGSEDGNPDPPKEDQK